MLKYQMLLSKCLKVTNWEESLKLFTSEDNFFPLRQRWRHAVDQLMLLEQMCCEALGFSGSVPGLLPPFALGD